ncbi:MAG: DUF3016 domain-containing protein [Methylovirgula sp.]
MPRVDSGPLIFSYANASISSKETNLGTADAGRLGAFAVSGRDGSMRLSAAIVIALSSIIVSVQAAKAEVLVTFVKSFYYGNLQGKSESQRAETLEDIRKTFDELGKQYFTAGQVLRVEVLDYSSAGIVVPKGTPQPFEMELRYNLEQEGKILQHDHETLSDVGYVEKPADPAAKPPEKKEGEHKKPETLVREKAILREWFAERFVAMKPLTQ